MKRRALQTAPDAPPERLDAFLARALAWTSAQADALVQTGAVYVRGKRARDGALLLGPGTPVVAVLEETGASVLEAAPAAFQVPVLFEDAALLAVDKPAGMTAQPTAGRVGDSLLDWAQAHLSSHGLRAGLVHRLDRETTGVTVFGRTPFATTQLAEDFRLGNAKKRYLAVVQAGLPAEGEITLPLSKDPSRPGRYRASDVANGVPAHTIYRRLAEGDGFSLVELLPQTGRTHQLRAHLTAIGFPIAGDARYGGERTLGGLPAPRCLLHAERLQIPHPSTLVPLTLRAPIPEDLKLFARAAGVELASADEPAAPSA